MEGKRDEEFKKKTLGKMSNWLRSKPHAKWRTEDDEKFKHYRPSISGDISPFIKYVS